MASDPREERAVRVEVAAELDEWLEERAATLEVDRADVIGQLLASYRAAHSLDGDLDPAAVFGEDPTDALAIDEAVADSVDDRLGAIEEEFQEKIVDVRERVIQVKQETDTKVPADHDHDAFDRIDALDGRLQDLAETVGDLEATVDALRADVDEDLGTEVAEVGDWQDAMDDRLADVEEKLRRVAWVVSDLEDDAGGRSSHEQAVARIKRAAVQEGLRQADCERCGETVDVALLTDPECPHCNGTVADVRPAGGILRKKAVLVAATQLESGVER